MIKVDESSVHETSEAVNGDTGSHSASVSGYVYYPGTADISFQDEYGRTYVVNVVVLPYENPLKSLDVTNVKWWSLSGKVDKFNAYLPKNGLSFRKNTAKPTVKLKAADGWKIMDVTVKCKSRSKGSKNQSVTLNEVKKKSKTVKLKKVSKGDLIQVTVTLQNSATQAEQTVRLGSFH